MALFVIFVTLVIDVIGIGIAFPIMPKLVQEMTGGDIVAAAAIYGWLVALYSLMQFLVAPFLGALSDRFGRRPLLILSLAGLAVDYIILALAPNLFFLALARLVGGMLSASFSTAFAYVADVSPKEKRAQNFGLVGAAIGFGFIAGPVIGGILGEYGPRVPFAAAAVICLVDIAFAFFFLPESLKPENRRKFEPAQANPLGAMQALRHYPNVLPLAASFIFANLAERILEATWVLYAGYRYGWGPKEVGISFAVVGFLLLISQAWLVRVTVPRFGERRMMLIGLLLTSICFMLYAFAYQGWMLYAIMVVHVLGWGAVGPSIQALASRAVPGNEQGLLQGALTSLATLSGVVAAPFGSMLFSFFIGPNTPFLFPGASFVAGSLLFLLAFAFGFGTAQPEAAAEAEGRA